MLERALLTACTNVLESEALKIIEMTGPRMFIPLVEQYLERPEASYLMLPTSALFDSTLQHVHNEAQHTVNLRWRLLDNARHTRELALST